MVHQLQLPNFMKGETNMFTFTSILHDDSEDDRPTLPAPAPEEDETLPTFDFPEARS